MRGATCKSYEVWGKLSQGGMGEVWLARHAELALPVIIKSLRPTADEPFAQLYARLLSEARLAARLTSPKVVRVIDVGVHTPQGRDPIPFLVEEYVDGIDLAELDTRRRAALHRPLPLWAVCEQVAQAAEGLHAAHQAGVVHRDVKPSNLFGHSGALVKVGDFGVAFAPGGFEPTAQGSTMGTPIYMAPEQLIGDRVDRRADVYSLGATAFALRYGEPPFPNPLESLRENTEPRFPPPRSPEEAYFQHVVARMLARRPEARYANLMMASHQLRPLARATAPRVLPIRSSAYVVELGQVRISFAVGDLAATEADALVSSASSEMLMRSGVAESLRKAAGDEVEAEAMAGGEQALGECVATGAGRLRARGILHAVGGWNEVSCVARAMHRALLLAEEHGYERIALPAISTGNSRVSIESCADAMMGALRIHLLLGGSRLRELRFVLYDEPAFRRFTDVALGALLGSDEAFRFDDEVDAPSETSEPTLFVPATRGSLTPSAPSEPAPAPAKRVVR
jgi:serine/threonine-protein kinase